MLKISDAKQKKLIYILCIMYTSVYLAKLNYGALAVEIIKEMGCTKSAAGLVGSFFFFSYGIGQVVNGFLAKYMNEKYFMTAADYPGLDILTCNPEEYNCNSAKYIQMAARKKGTKGTMVELCPFNNKDVFMKDPWNNMHTIVGLLAMSGVRRFNSYFRADFSEVDERFSSMKGYRSKQDAIKFNEYVGRIGYMLDGVWNDCNLYVYRPIEDGQVKQIPKTSGALGFNSASTDGAVAPLVKNRIFPTGVDFMYLDAEDLVEIVKTTKNGSVKVSGSDMKILVVPGVDYIDPEAKKSMVELQKMGVKVLFNNSVPNFKFDDDDIDLTQHFEPTKPDKIVE